jgi:hypothetical protein
MKNSITPMKTSCHQTGVNQLNQAILMAGDQTISACTKKWSGNLKADNLLKKNSLYTL